MSEESESKHALRRVQSPGLAWLSVELHTREDYHSRGDFLSPGPLDQSLHKAASCLLESDGDAT
jgi:hypothetical protein